MLKQLPRILLATTVLTTLLVSLSDQGFAIPVTAKSADAFVDSIGVNTHLDYGGSPYARFFDIVKPKLQELGIRHIRDGVHLHEELLNKVSSLGKLGIKSNLVFNNEFNTVVAIAKATTGAIEAVEGPNQTDLEVSNFSYNGQKFPSATRAYQQGLYAAIKNDPATKYLPVVLPSMGWGENAQKLGYLESGDYCNMHSYPNIAARPTHDIDWYFIPNARIICGESKPLIATETGYHNAISDSFGLSEQATGKYLPRLLLENFNRSIKRSYLYELIDQGTGSNQQDRFGLLRYDGSAKPAFTAIRNLISLLKEPGANFVPKNLDYTLDSNNQDLHSTLLQKSTGEFYLILWQDAVSWDNETKKDIPVANRTVWVELASPANQVEIYDPAKSSVSIQTVLDTQKIEVSVPDHPVVLKLITE